MKITPGPRINFIREEKVANLTTPAYNLIKGAGLSPKDLKIRYIDHTRLPSLCLPILKLILKNRYHAIIGISRGGDPIVWTLKKMLKKIKPNFSPKFENFLLSTPVKLNFGESVACLLTEKERNSYLPEEIKKKLLDFYQKLTEKERMELESNLKMKFAELLTFNLKEVLSHLHHVYLYKKNPYWEKEDSSREFQHQNLRSMIRIRDFLSPLFNILLSQTEAARFLERNPKILVVDDQLATGGAVFMAQTVIKAFAPNTKVDFALLVEEQNKLAILISPQELSKNFGIEIKAVGVKVHREEPPHPVPNWEAGYNSLLNGPDWQGRLNDPHHPIPWTKIEIDEWPRKSDLFESMTAYLVKRLPRPEEIDLSTFEELVYYQLWKTLTDKEVIWTSPPSWRVAELERKEINHQSLSSKIKEEIEKRYQQGNLFDAEAAEKELGTRYSLSYIKLVLEEGPSYRKKVGASLEILFEDPLLAKLTKRYLASEEDLSELILLTHWAVLIKNNLASSHQNDHVISED